MRKASWLVGTLCFLVFTAAVAPAGPFGQEKADPKTEELQKQVAALEARVAALEKKIEDLTLTLPQKLPDFKQLPKGWRVREFNGMMYYIIPVSQDQKKNSAVIR
jgi:hypothetical protein